MIDALYEHISRTTLLVPTLARVLGEVCGWVAHSSGRRAPSKPNVSPDRLYLCRLSIFAARGMSVNPWEPFKKTCAVIPGLTRATLEVTHLSNSD